MKYVLKVAALTLSVMLASCATPEKIEGENWVAPRENSSNYITHEAAIHQKQAGWVLVQCIAQSNGLLSDCRVLIESPEGWGFGDAALSMRGGMQVKSAGHRPYMPRVGEHIHMPVYFCTPGRPEECETIKNNSRPIIIRSEEVYDLAISGACDGALREAKEINSATIINDVSALCRR